MHLSSYLDLLRRAERSLAESYRTVSDGYPDDNDVHFATLRLAEQCTARAETLGPALSRYEPVPASGPDRMHPDPMTQTRGGPVGLLRDLQDLYQLANFIDITWVMVEQAANGAREPRLAETAQRHILETQAQLAWLRLCMKSAAPQTLLVAT